MCCNPSFCGESAVQVSPARFSDLPEGFTELGKAIILVVRVYYSERIQVYIGKGKRCMRHPGGVRCELPVASF